MVSNISALNPLLSLGALYQFSRCQVFHRKTLKLFVLVSAIRYVVFMTDVGIGFMTLFKYAFSYLAFNITCNALLEVRNSFDSCIYSV